ncbi:transcriptional regulator [Actinomadura craniellae]|uniref:Transcriptional regulator n=1 Tax=Actinomadura craniellae TaxID=2231787 RepID=A0A365GWU8_9ACTN|nr:helix-turn-helix transcriptional regulator [Actinomadura craniellae]RAY11286.1 transcriptional regulator [Actinomadura craniellae]
MIERRRLAEFIRARREALTPEDVGMPRGPRRRTSGLRREEVAVLSGVSSDYYSKIEQYGGPVPSEQILAALARGLQLTLDERDHLFRLAGYAVPARVARRDHVNAGLMRVLARLQDTPAQVVTQLGETLVQTPLAVALLGDETAHVGRRRSRIYRWFTDPRERERTPAEDHRHHSEMIVGHLVAASANEALREPVAELVQGLSRESEEFARLWERQPVPTQYCEMKRILHRDVGAIDVYGQTLFDPDQFQALMIFTAAPGTDSHDKLRLLSVLGTQRLTLS